MKFKVLVFLVVLLATFLFFNKFSKISLDEMKVSDVIIDGFNNIKKNEIQNKQYIKNLINVNILDVDAEKIRNDIIGDFPIIKEAMVRKVYPHVINVYINEREPLFLIFDGKQSYFYDKFGNLIKIDNDIVKKYDVFQNIIYLEGEYLQSELGFLTKLFLNRDFSKRISGLYKIDGRRLDMIIDKKIKVMLPEKLGSYSEISSIFHMIDSMKLKNNIKTQALYVVVDARMKGKVFIKNIGDSG